MKTKLNSITWYSQLLLIIIYVATFASGFYFGGKYREAMILSIENKPIENIISASFNCDNSKIIFVDFLSNGMALKLSNGRSLVLLRVISASGARYANSDESIVFWNKGDTAFIQENGVITYNDCIVRK
jgi:membrane-bound inhibitor of C-type lysozyme